jgi:N-acetylmuramoyl-L-alanine amidase
MQPPPNLTSPSDISASTNSSRKQKPILIRLFKTRRRLAQGTLYQITLIFGVAFLLATLFTAWTPGQYNFNPPSQITSAAYLPVPSLSPSNQPTPSQPTWSVIGIVAGHWKNDSGAVCPDGLREVDVNLNIATLVQKMLEGQGYDVDLLKEFDTRLFNYKAAALVSIHNDSCDFINNEATGFKVSSAMGDRHPEQSARLTACIRSRYANITGKPLHSTSLTPDMTSYHAFGEIDENTPAAIIETGFLNLDREFLTQHPELAAQGIVSGILCFIKNEEIALPTTANPSSLSTQPQIQPTP